MKRHLLWFAFSLSLLFNVFFAVGYAKARAEAQTGSSRAVGLVTQELNLDKRQAAAFASLRTGGDEDVLRPGIALAQQELIAELDHEEPDPDRVRAIVARQGELIQQQRLSGFDRMCDFVRVLTPEQRHQMFKRLRHGGPFSAERHRELVKRFDKNGDGELDETEKAEAHTFIDARRAERRGRMEERRKEMRERFDANGDGELDEEERAALDAWRREHRPGRQDSGR